MIVSPTKLNREDARKMLAESIASNGKTNYSLLLEIKGRYLVDNNLVEAWAVLRGHSIKEVYAPGYTDHVTLQQAQSLGILDFILKQV